jgi:hypothetical protein
MRFSSTNGVYAPGGAGLFVNARQMMPGGRRRRRLEFLCVLFTGAIGRLRRVEDAGLKPLTEGARRRDPAEIREPEARRCRRSGADLRALREGAPGLNWS